MIFPVGVVDRIMSISNVNLRRAMWYQELSGNAIDRSIYRRAGTVNGATQVGGRTPYAAPCYSVDGMNDYVDWDTNISDLNNWNSGTIIALARTSTVAAGIRDVFHIRSNTGKNDIEIRISGSGFQIILIVNSASEDIFSAGIISANTWFTSAVSWQDSSGDGNIYYYKDGAQIGTDSTAATMNAEAWTECTVGSARTGGTQFWSGLIGPVFCWNTRLTAAQINMASRLLRRV